MPTALACPTCGRPDEGGDATRFCGGCGALLRPRSPAGGAARPAEPTSPPTTEALPASRGRRGLAAAVVLAAVGAVLLVGSGDPVEVVTADGLGTSSGRSSNLAVTDVSIEHWRVDLRSSVEEIGFGWVSGAARIGGSLVAVGEATTVLDLATGEVEAELPPIAGTPVVRDGHLVVVVRDLLLEIRPDDGAVVRSVRLDRDVTPDPVFPHVLGDGYLVAGRERLSRISGDGTVRWSTPPPSPGQELVNGWVSPPLAMTVVDGAVVVADHERVAVLGLDDGSLWWRTERRSDRRGPNLEPVVADGRVFLVELHARSGDPGYPVSAIATARDLRTGEPLWQATEPLAAALVGVRDGVLFATSDLSDDAVSRLDVETGGRLAPLPYLEPLTPPGVAALGPDGTVLLGDRRGDLVAVDDETGAERWRVPDGDPWSAVVLPEHVLVNGPGGSRVVDADGRIVHQLPSASPLLPVGIAVSGRTAMVAPGLAVDLVDGTARIDEPAAERWSRGVAAPGGFIVDAGRGGVVVDRNGAERWSLLDPEPTARGPVGWRDPVAVVGDRLLTSGQGGAGGTLELLDRDGRQVGEPLEDHPLYGPAVVDGDLVVGRRYRTRAGPTDELVAVRATPAGPQLVWVAPSPGGRLLGDRTGLYEVTSASIARRDPDDGRLTDVVALPRLVEPDRLALSDGTLVGVSGRSLLGIDARTGALAWEQGLAAPVTAGPTIAGDRVYVGTEEGDVVLLDLDGGRHAARETADGAIRDVVAVRGVLLVLTDDHAFALGPATLPDRTTRSEPREVGTVDVPVP